MAFTPTRGKPVEQQASTTSPAAFTPTRGKPVNTASPQTQSQKDESTMQKNDEGGILSRFVKAIAHPFIKTAATAYAPVAATGEFIKRAAKPGAMNREDLNAVNYSLSKPRDFGFLGAVRPASINQDTGENLSFGQSVADITGTGAELAANLVGGEGAVGVGRAGVKGLIRSGIKTGVTTGAEAGFLTGVGEGLQERESLLKTLGQGAIGAVGGALIGGVSGAAIPLLGKFLGGTGRIAKTAAVAVNDSAKAAETLATKPPVVQAAVRTGIDPTVVDFVNGASKTDKGAFRTMFEIAKNKATNLRQTEQPKEVVGKAILTRAKAAIGGLNKATERIRDSVKAMAPDPIDITDQFDEFSNLLAQRGLEVSPETGKLLNTGEVPEGDMKIYQTMYDLIKPDEEGVVTRTPQKLDAFRRRIFNELDLAKKRQEAFSSTVDQDAESFRSILMKPLENLNKEYKLASQDYATTIKPVQDFLNLMGYKGPLERISTKDLRAGEIAMRMLGNAADRPLSVIQALEEAAVKNGFKKTDNIFDQVLFSDMLENLFGTSQTRSLRGEVGRAGMDVANELGGAAADIAKGDIFGLIGRGFKAALGKSDQAKIDAIQKLISR